MTDRTTDDLLAEIKYLKDQVRILNEKVAPIEDEIRKRCGHLTPSAPCPIVPFGPYYPPDAPLRWGEITCKESTCLGVTPQWPGHRHPWSKGSH